MLLLSLQKSMQVPVLQFLKIKDFEDYWAILIKQNCIINAEK